MKTIDQENDDHVFSIGIKSKGSVFVDGFELSSRCMDIDGMEEGNAKPKDIATAMRDVAWCENGTSITDMTDHELFAAGTKALVEMEKLGNE